MNKLKVLVLSVIIGVTSCQNSETKLKKLEIAKKFYSAINNSNSSKITELISDVLYTIDDGYEQKFDQKTYAEWVKWDSVFQPNYEILQIKEENGVVKAKISKTDKRISFLHKDPIIMEEIIQFKDIKIKNVIRNSVSFKVEKFVKNRDSLVDWVSTNYPELNGFLYNQTKNGAINYLKAIELYKKSK